MLFVARSLVQNAAFSSKAIRQLAHRFGGSTGMNGNLASAGKVFAEYATHVDVRGRDVLELGPGHTPQVLELAKRAGARSCRGLDVERMAEADDREIAIDIYDGRAMPYGDETFDVVWSSDVLEHVRFPEQTIREAHRVLRPGGWLLAHIDLRDHYRLHDESRWLDCLRYPEPLWWAMTSNRSSFVNRLRSSEWLSLLRATGFEVESARELRSEVLHDLHRRGKVRRWGGSLTSADAAVYRIEVVARRRRNDGLEGEG
jgi:SAM-dependent methyltransferase